MTHVRNSLIIETWNPDFNCSVLLQLKQQGKIQNFRCNGTDNGTVADTDTDDGAGPPLAPGAWAGVGIGATAFAFGLICVFVYFWRKSHQAPKQAINPNPSTTKPEPAEPCLDSNEIREAEGDRMFLERPPQKSNVEMYAVQSPREADSVQLPVEIG